MATLSLLDRERTRTRDRPRPSAPGNFITDQRRATVYSLTFGLTPQHYIKWWPYFFPETKAIGYRNNPLISPAWVEVGPSAPISTVFDIAGGIIPGAPGSPIQPASVPIISAPPAEVLATFTPSPISVEQVILPPVAPSNPVPGSTLITETAHKPGQMFSTLIGVVPEQLISSEFAIRGLTILADSANAGTIWCGYNPQVAVGNGFPLIAGASKDFNIDDLSAIWLIGSAANLTVHVEYTK